MASSTSRSSSTKKSTKRASPAKKSTGGSTTKKTTGGTSRSQKSSEGSSARKAPKAEAPRPARAGQVAAQAAAELLELTGKAAEGVTGLERTDDGWTVQVEVVEVRRIPDTTDVLALYEVQTDDQGSLQGYRRIRRYARGVPGEN